MNIKTVCKKTTKPSCPAWLTDDIMMVMARAFLKAFQEIDTDPGKPAQLTDDEMMLITKHLLKAYRRNGTESAASH